MTGQYVEERERERVKERLRIEGKRELRKGSEEREGYMVIYGM